MSKWKRNIDEPFKPEVVKRLVDLNPTSRGKVLNDLANKAVSDMLINLWDTIGRMEGTANDFIFVGTIATQAVIPTMLDMCAETNVIERRHVAAAKYLIDNLPEKTGSLFETIDKTLQERDKLRKEPAKWN